MSVMRKDNYKIFIKYIVHVIAALILLFVWKGVFILQGAIGYQGSIFLLPLKLLPIFLFTSFAVWLNLRMFDKNKVMNRRILSFVIAGVAVTASLCFQHYLISKRLRPFTFQNKMFSHLKPVNINNDSQHRLILSFAEYGQLMPLGDVDEDLTSYIANIVAETSAVFELRRLLDDENITNTCKQYIEHSDDYGNCIVDFQKEIYAAYQFTSTGNILLVAVGATGIHKIKKIMQKKYGEKSVYVTAKSVNDLIETVMIAAEKSKFVLINRAPYVKFSMGYDMALASIPYTIESEINYKFLTVTIDSVNGLITKLNKTLEADGGLKHRISQPEGTQAIEMEKIRFTSLKKLYLSFQNNGFTLDEIKSMEEDLLKEMETKLNMLKTQSFLFRISSFFYPSLNDLIVGDVLKKLGDQ